MAQKNDDSHDSGRSDEKLQETCRNTELSLQEQVLLFLGLNPTIGPGSLAFKVRGVDRVLGIERHRYEETDLIAQTQRLLHPHETANTLYQSTLQHSWRAILHAVVELDEPVEEWNWPSRALRYLLFLLAHPNVYSLDMRLTVLYTLLSVVFFLLSTLRWVKAWEDLWRTNNPPEFDQPGYLKTTENSQRFDDFTIIEMPFKVVGPVRTSWRLYLGCVLLNLKSMRYRHIRPTSTLCAWVFVPKHLSRDGEKVEVGALINIGGGAMVTGHPLDPAWTSLAVLDAARRMNMIYVAFDRRRLPQCNGEHAIEDSRDAFKFLFEEDELEKCLKSKYPHLLLNRRRIIATGESAGAFLVMILYCQFGRYLSGLYLRYGLFESYVRQPGSYMHGWVGVEQAALSLWKTVRLLRSLGGELPPRSGCFPSDWQYLAPVLAITGYWKELWNAETAMDYVDETTSCPNANTAVLFVHGSEDEHVLLSSAERMVKRLEKWPELDVKLCVLEGEKHGFDYSIPLSDERMSSFVELLQKIVRRSSRL